MEIGRVYDDHGPDVTAILVDRLWPRGIRKEDHRVGVWCKDVAPSTELRHWYGHQVERYEEFVRRYRAELESAAGGAALDRLAALATPPCVLVTATKDVEHSHLPTLVAELAEHHG